MNILKKALKFAAKKHKGQFRQDAAKTPYIKHPIAVAKLVKKAGGSIEAQVVAILHDTLEDTKTTYEELVENFGKFIADLVLEVTDSTEAVYNRFVELAGVEFATTLINNPKLLRREFKVQQALDMPKKALEARLVKLGDKVDNVRSLIENPPKWHINAIKGYAEACARVVEAGKGTNNYLEDLFFEYFKKIQETIEIKHSAWVAVKFGDEYLVAQRGISVKNPGLWNFFGGRIDDGEDKLTAAIRELKEEAGIAASDVALNEIGTLTFPEDVITLFVMEVSERMTPKLNKESSDFKWATLDELLFMNLHKPTFHFINSFMKKG